MACKYRIDILTLFPAAVSAMMDESIIGRAQRHGHVSLACHQIRDFTTNRQNQVDDYPYGGGRGCVMQAQPLYDCWRHLEELEAYAKKNPDEIDAAELEKRKQATVESYSNITLSTDPAEVRKHISTGVNSWYVPRERMANNYEG